MICHVVFMLGGNSLWLFAMQFTFLFFFFRRGEEGVDEVFSVIIKCIGSSLFRTVLGRQECARGKICITFT